METLEQTKDRNIRFDAALFPAWEDRFKNIGLQNDYEKAANSVAANGLNVFENYIAGLDPTDATSCFNANISFTNNVPCIGWSTSLNPDGFKEGLRWYTIYGKKKLDDTDWQEVQSGKEAEFNFFTVGAELP